MNGDFHEVPVAPPRPTGATTAQGSRPVAQVAAPLQPETRPLAQAAAAVIALVAALGVWLTYRVLVTTLPGQQLDDLARDGALYGQDSLWRVAEPVLDVVSVAFVVAGIGAAMLVAVVRRRWVVALQVAALVGGANLTTQVLKHYLLTRPDLLPGWYSGNTLPSGHTTVAASVSVALLFATPRAWRAVVALLGASYTAATGVATLVGQWHRPSDVVAALFVVLAWGALVCALTPSSSLDVAPRRHRLPTGEARPNALSSPGSSVVAGLLLLSALVAGTVALAGGVRLVDAASVPIGEDVTAYAVGVLGVLAATAVTFALLLLVRQATARPRE
ncbi:phosphatase PAP2 family protein [Isoptericola sediminis]|uniref:Phosphatase PAP2 family protein n=1 Tax=Isoptericola sediminis TaxID=2733572 RepID=A0A849K3Q0_9MICO|nr:phosphatase PAP2 family protein [Isoptericola sediminis]NNU26980.1 phosphatase PAP2 family protein [Isoptericola sediminis]